MRLYHGTLIHRSRDAWGTIEIVQDEHIRALHFGNAVRQSAMALHTPCQLVLPYTQAMVAGLLFNNRPRRALLVGLGGGSLVRFLLQYFPHCSLDVVEIREQVAKLARAYFLLPDLERLRIHIADGMEFVRQRPATPYDLILVDAYDHAGIAPAVVTAEFYRHCRATLGEEGVLAVNQWGRERASFRALNAALHEAFGKQLLQLPAEGASNVVTLAQPRPIDKRRLRRLLEAARSLESTTETQFVRLAGRLHRYNSPILTRCLPLSR